MHMLLYDAPSGWTKSNPYHHIRCNDVSFYHLSGMIKKNNINNCQLETSTDTIQIIITILDRITELLLPKNPQCHLTWQCCQCFGDVSSWQRCGEFFRYLRCSSFPFFIRLIQILTLLACICCIILSSLFIRPSLRKTEKNASHHTYPLTQPQLIFLRRPLPVFVPIAARSDLYRSVPIRHDTTHSSARYEL